MSMTLLELIQAATSEMGVPVPQTVVGNAAADVVQQLGLLNEIGRKLYTGYEWQDLNVQYRFTTQYTSTTGDITDNSEVITNIPSTTGLDTTYMLVGTGVPQDCSIVSVDSATQVTMNQPMEATTVGASLDFCKVAYAMPSDYQKPINRTQWDKTRHWEMIGPDTPQMWQWLLSGYIATGPRIHYRILGNKFTIWPPMTSNEYLGFEYISRGWVLDASGDRQTSFTADDDTSIFQDDLLISALKFKYFSVKGFDTTDYALDYQAVLSTILATEKGGKTLLMAGRPPNILINMTNIPDQGFGI